MLRYVMFNSYTTCNAQQQPTEVRPKINISLRTRIVLNQKVSFSLNKKYIYTHVKGVSFLHF